MGNIKDLFVSYEIAKQLKEKGYTGLILAQWLKTKGEKPVLVLNEDFNDFPIMGLTSHTEAPLYQQVVDWFREKYGIDIIQDKELEFSGYIFYLYKGSEEIGQSDLHPEYYDALNEAIEEAIKLIDDLSNQKVDNCPEH